MILGSDSGLCEDYLHEGQGPEYQENGAVAMTGGYGQLTVSNKHIM